MDRLTEAAGPNAVLMEAPEVVEQPEEQPAEGVYNDEEEAEEEQKKKEEEEFEEEEEQALSGLTSTDPRAQDATDLSIYKCGVTS